SFLSSSFSTDEQHICEEKPAVAEFRSRIVSIAFRAARMYSTQSRRSCGRESVGWFDIRAGFHGQGGLGASRRSRYGACCKNAFQERCGDELCGDDPERAPGESSGTDQAHEGEKHRAT